MNRSIAKTCIKDFWKYLKIVNTIEDDGEIMLFLERFLMKNQFQYTS